MAKQILTGLDLLALPSLTTPKTGSVGFGAKADGLYQKIGSAEGKLATQSDIDTAIDGIEIGGRNLLLDSRNIKITIGDGSSGNLSFVNNENLIKVTAINNKGRQNFYNTKFADYWINKNEIFENIQKGEEYTLSMEVRYSGDSRVRYAFDTRGVNSAEYAYTDYITDTNGEWVKVVATKKESGRSLNNQSLIIGWFDEIKVGDYTEIRNIKLEKGNKATDCTPAPEDQVSDWSETDATSFSYIKNKPTQLSHFTDNIGVGTHIANKANPHNVTKSQVGLGSVDNVKQAAKSEFDTHAGNNTIHITATERTNWNLAYTNNHTHANKGVIDALTQGHIDVLNFLSVVDGNIKVDTTLWATGGLSALGLGDDGSGSGGGVDMLDSWANYTTAKADFYVPASLLVPFRSDTLSRLTSLESGSATSIETTGSGNAITSLTKSGNVITAYKGSSFALASHSHTIANVTGLQTALNSKQATLTQGSNITISGSTISAVDTKYSVATTGASGLMSSGDKKKLNGIASNATNLSLGTSSTTAYRGDRGSTAYNHSQASGNPHGTTFAQISSKPTSLSGFGITDAYTKAEVNSLANYVGGYSSTNGFLVKTDVARTENSMLVLHIKGNSYGGRVPINTFVQVYNYRSSDAIINTGALNNGYAISEVKVFYYNNLVYFWVPQQTSFMTMTFQLLKAEGQVNRVDSVSNSAVPTTGVEKMVIITPRTAWFEDTLTSLSQLTDNIGVASHIANKSNPHAVTKSQVGLGNVDNTADSSKNVLSATRLTTARNINGTSFNGSASITTARWGTSRTLSFTGDVTGSSSVNGSKNVATAMTLKNSGVTAGTYRSVTVDAKGRVTAGTNPTTLAGYGITALDVKNTAGLNSDTLALGMGSEVIGSSSIAIGSNSKAYGSNSLSIMSFLDGVDSVVVNGYLEGDSSVVISGIIEGTNSIGVGGEVYGDNSVAIGRYSICEDPNTGVLGTNGANGNGANKWIIPGNLAIGKDTPATSALDVNGVIKASVGANTPKVDFGNGFTIEPSGTELVFKYNGVIKQRMLSDGTILGTGGITALST